MSSRYIVDKDSWIKHYDFIILDGISLVISFIISYFIKFGNFSFVISDMWQSFILIALLFDLIIILFTQTFDGINNRYGSEELLKSIIHTIYNFACCGVIFFVLKRGALYSRQVIIITYAIYFCLSLITRIAWKRIIKIHQQPRKTILVVGTKDNAPQIIRSVSSSYYNDHEVKAVCVVDEEVGKTFTAIIDTISPDGQIKEITSSFTNSVAIEEIASYMLMNNIDELVVGVDPTRIDRITYKTLVDNGKGVHLQISALVGFETDNQIITRVGTFNTLSVGIYAFTAKQLVYLVIKRFIDIILGLLGVILTLPLFALVKICYLCSGDNQSIVYTQTRVGKNGKEFKLYKFRSMVQNADEVLGELLKDPKYKAEWDENQKFAEDPRITPIGKFLRSTSLDEMPQFLNVLKGEMAFIGPRPLVVGELQLHNGLNLYNQIKPGLTGWWGCNGRSNTTYEERLELEYYYVKNFSFYIDVLCLIKTVVSLLKREGAK